MAYLKMSKAKPEETTQTTAINPNQPAVNLSNPAMKYLLLMRHAKSAWDEPHTTDFDRSLNERGKKDAPDMAGRIKAFPFKPDLLISSPAKRAIKTAKAVAEVLHYPEKKVELENKLGTTTEYEALQKLSNDLKGNNELLEKKTFRWLELQEKMV